MLLNTPTALMLHMLYSGHDSGAGNGECGTTFGGDPGLCALRLQKIAGLFELPDGSNLDATCREYDIDAVISGGFRRRLAGAVIFDLQSAAGSRQRLCQGVSL